MKKKILFVAAVVALLAILAAGTLAYFTSRTVVHNVITTGNIQIELVEKTIAEDGTETDFPAAGITGVMPGTDVSKVVTVKNTGVGAAWIRVKLDASITSADGDAMDTGYMTYEVLDGWTEGEDGYYYYDQVVEAGESTTALIETVAFDEKMGNAYQNCTANLAVSAEAVQAANNGETVLEAAGWPEE